MNVAVCLYGEPRTYEFTSPYIKSHYEQSDVIVDYFIHCWSEEGKYTTRPEKYIKYDRQKLFENLQRIYGEGANICVDSPAFFQKCSNQYSYANLYNSQIEALKLMFRSTSKVYDLVFVDRLDAIRYACLNFKERGVHIKDMPIRYYNIPDAVFNDIEGRHVVVPFAGIDSSNSFFKNKPYVGDRVFCFSYESSFRYCSELLPWIISSERLDCSEIMLYEFFQSKGMVLHLDGICNYENNNSVGVEPGWILRKHSLDYVEKYYADVDKETKLYLLTVALNGFDDTYDDILHNYPGRKYDFYEKKLQRLFKYNICKQYVLKKYSLV